MKIPGFRLFQKGDYPASPPWFLKFLELLNRPMEDHSRALGGGIEFDNLSVEIRELEVKNDTPTELTLRTLKGRPAEMAVVWSNLFDYPELAWEIVADDTVRFKVRFASAPADPVLVRVRLQK